MIGTGINFVAGAVENYQNKLKIAEMRDELNADLLMGFSEEERRVANLKLLQIKRMILIKNNRSREIISSVEKEIIEQMKEDVVNRREKLKAVQATQLDIANVMIEQRIFQKDMLNSLSLLEEAVKYKSENPNKENEMVASACLDGDNSEFLLNKIRNIDKRLRKMEETNEMIYETQRRLEVVTGELIKGLK